VNFPKTCRKIIHRSPPTMETAQESHSINRSSPYAIPLPARGGSLIIATADGLAVHSETLHRSG
ncbi:hypothetical protein OSJ57_20865, partial [Sphingomonas sp. HH69]